ncbi:MAG: hypothetical protein MUC51_04140 [Anaerolineae bacterium]|jgi:hypothetical protein|nr:hypothetical protein [Anaerolineae bacterium]
MNRIARAFVKTGLPWVGLALIILVTGCTAPLTAPTAIPHTATPSGTAVPMPTITPIPGIQATLTALPKQPPLPPSEAQRYQELRAAVERCNAYNENRKTGILAQIGYVLQPATMPSDFLLLYGDEWRGRLIYGSAYLSALEWKLAGRDRSSCLYPIGVSFNALLRDLHQNTFPEFE